MYPRTGEAPQSILPSASCRGLGIVFGLVFCVTWLFRVRGDFVCPRRWLAFVLVVLRVQWFRLSILLVRVWCWFWSCCPCGGFVCSFVRRLALVDPVGIWPKSAKFAPQACRVWIPSPATHPPPRIPSVKSGRAVGALESADLDGARRRPNSHSGNPNGASVKHIFPDVGFLYFDMPP